MRGKAWRTSSAGDERSREEQKARLAVRWVLHVDLDQFLASVELQRHPELKGLPVIVGGNGDPAEPRKVVTCASYEARAYGVHAGMPLRTAARKCPDATFLPSDPEAYDVASDRVMGLLRDLGHPLEVWGWDEAYLGAEVDDPFGLAERIRTVIEVETGLSCSVGISDNKQRAKVATGLAKPAGIYRLDDANWMTVMGDRDVDALWGVGPKTAKRLAGLRITTVADLAATDAALLTATFGPTTGLWILLLAKGGGDAGVSAEPWVPRSRSHVVTFPEDLTDQAEMDSAVVELARQTLAETTAAGRTVTRVAVTTRTKTFFTRTKIRKLANPGIDPEPIIATALELLHLFELDRPIRLLGVRLELAMPESPVVTDGV
ncbi:MAG: polymerase [Mycobacterium sp.]|jgi:DNA polymerase-4|nr:polymerase [Mycobacterium sp.]